MSKKVLPHGKRPKGSFMTWNQGLLHDTRPQRSSSWQETSRLWIPSYLHVKHSHGERSNNSPLSHAVHPVLILPYWSFQLNLFMKVSFSPDMILCGWLGLKHQLTNSCFPRLNVTPLIFFKRSYQKALIVPVPWSITLHGRSHFKVHFKVAVTRFSRYSPVQA